MSEQVHHVCRALENGDYRNALSYMCIGDYSVRGPPQIPAFSARTKPPTSCNIPPTRPKIYGPPPYPAFQRRNSQTAARNQGTRDTNLKDSGVFPDYSRSTPPPSSELVPSYPDLQDPSGFFPTILISSRTSSVFPATPSVNNNKEETPPQLYSGEECEELCPYCSTRQVGQHDNNRPAVTAVETRQLVFDVLKAVKSESSESSSRFSSDLLPKEVRSATDVQGVVRPAAILSGDYDAILAAEDKRLSVMFSTDTFQDSSASSTQELCVLCSPEEGEGDSTTSSDTRLPACGPLSDSVLPTTANIRLMTLS